MKKIKINLAIMAMVLGITAAFAFKAPAEKAHTKFSNSWFLYNGGDTSDPASYSITSGTPGCNGRGALCAIEGTEQGSTGEPTQATVDNPVAIKDKN